jgi:hypothetical protein
VSAGTLWESAICHRTWFAPEGSGSPGNASAIRDDRVTRDAGLS